MNLKFVSKRPEDSIFVYVTGHGEDVEIQVKAWQYYDEKMSVSFDLKETKEFVEYLKKAIVLGEKRAEKAKEED